MNVNQIWGQINIYTFAHAITSTVCTIPPAKVQPIEINKLLPMRAIN